MTEPNHSYVRKNLHAEIQGATSAVPKDPADEPTFQKASAAALRMASVVDAFAVGDSDAGLQGMARVLEHFRDICRDYKLELAEVLPHETCAECGASCLDFVRRGARVECALCEADREADRPTSVGPLEGDTGDLTALGCLDLAKNAIRVRGPVYGLGDRCLDLTARMWTAVLGTEIAPHQVALCMMALKMARLCESPGHGDSWVDAAGYAALGAQVKEAA